MASSKRSVSVKLRQDGKKKEKESYFFRRHRSKPEKSTKDVDKIEKDDADKGKVGLFSEGSRTKTSDTRSFVTHADIVLSPECMKKSDVLPSISVSGIAADDKTVDVRTSPSRPLSSVDYLAQGTEYYMDAGSGMIEVNGAKYETAEPRKLISKLSQQLSTMGHETAERISPLVGDISQVRMRKRSPYRYANTDSINLSDISDDTSFEKYPFPSSSDDSRENSLSLSIPDADTSPLKITTDFPILDPISPVNLSPISTCSSVFPTREFSDDSPLDYKSSEMEDEQRDIDVFTHHRPVPHNQPLRIVTAVQRTKQKLIRRASSPARMDLKEHLSAKNAQNTKIAEHLIFVDFMKQCTLSSYLQFFPSNMRMQTFRNLTEDDLTDIYHVDEPKVRLLLMRAVIKAQECDETESEFTAEGSAMVVSWAPCLTRTLGIRVY